MEKRSALSLNRRLRARLGPPTEEEVQARLDDVRRIIGVGAKPIGSLLPEAIAQATEERGTALATALEPAVTRTIRVVANRDSEWLGEVLSPTIGTAVRKAVADAFAALMQRLNEALEESISVRSFQWRLEAHRTGRPFAEVVLLRTLIYRVEQVFLIHGETGLVLQHLVAEGAPSVDPDQVAAMLSAIDSFGREAFEAKTTGTYLQEFAVSDLTVWVERGPSVAVAVAIRGLAPRRLLDLVTETRERILLDYRTELADFEADVTPFVASRPLLARCLTEQRVAPPRRGTVILAVLAAAVVTVIVVFIVTAFARDRQLAAYRDALDAEPGIVITSADRSGGRFRIHGLRDPIATDPAELAARRGRPATELSFVPFQSLEPGVVEKRFRRASAPPPGVTVKVEGDTLRLSGHAPRQWIDRALALASTTPGIERVHSTVSDTTALELASVTRSLQAVVARFDHGSYRLSPALLPLIEQSAQLIDRVRHLSTELQRESCVLVIGDADSTGDPRFNAMLARKRAAAVRGVLRETDFRLTTEMVRERARSAADIGPRTRSARFEVRTRPESPGPACSDGEVE